MDGQLIFPFPFPPPCVRQVRAYISDLCDCLADKSPMVEALEDSLAELREDRAIAAKDREQVRNEVVFSAYQSIIPMRLIFDETGNVYYEVWRAAVFTCSNVNIPL